LWETTDGYWWVLDSLGDYVYKYNSDWIYTGLKYNTKWGSPIVHGTNGYGMYLGLNGFWYIPDIADDTINQYDSNWTYTGISYSTLAEDSVMTGIYGTERSGVPTNIIFVNYAATGLNNGTSWTNAYTSFQTALNSAVSGKQIWVAKGTYQTSYDYGLGIGNAGNHFRLINGSIIIAAPGISVRNFYQMLIL